MAEPVSKELLLSDGSRIVLYDYGGAPDPVLRQRNVVRLDALGREQWRVGEYGASDASTFTNIWLGAEGELRAYNFDGGEYLIDLETGQCIPGVLLR